LGEEGLGAAGGGAGGHQAFEFLDLAAERGERRVLGQDWDASVSE